MRSQTRWITAAVAAAVAALAIGQASAQSYGYSSNGYSNNNGYANGHSRTVRCESTNSRQVLCRVNTQGGVRIVRQLSKHSCMQGRNWNYDSRGIWVSGGCRADFAISSGRGDRRGDGYTSNGYYSNGYNSNGYDSNDSRYDNNDYRDRGYRNPDPGYDDNDYNNDSGYQGYHQP